MRQSFRKGQDIAHGKDILPFPARCPLMRAEHCVDEATTVGSLEIFLTANQRDNGLEHFCSPASRLISLETPLEAAPIAAGMGRTPPKMERWPR